MSWRMINLYVRQNYPRTFLVIRFIKFQADALQMGKLRQNIILSRLNLTIQPILLTRLQLFLSDATPSPLLHLAFSSIGCKTSSCFL